MTIYINGVAIIGDMFTAVYDPDTDGLIAVAQIEMVAAMLAQGQGLGSGSIEIATPTGRTIATGSYAGNDAADRQITTGFKCSMAVIFQGAAVYIFWAIPGVSTRLEAAGQSDYTTKVALHATDGFRVRIDNSNNSGNDTGQTYDYWAISE